MTPTCFLLPSSSSPLSLIIIFTFSLLSLTLFFFSFIKNPKKTEDFQHPQPQTTISSLQLSLSIFSNKIKNTHLLNSTRLSSNSPYWDALFSNSRVCYDPVESGSNSGDSENNPDGKLNKKKKKKKKGKKKEKIEEEKEVILEKKDDFVCLNPFTSSSSLTQKKIKVQYDELVKSHDSKGLTFTQVCQFINCLIDAKNELQHKSECVKRKYTITKALLLKADRSSFDRLRQQIIKLEFEQKRLEEDAFVYNWLQHQLKLSPAYKRMVEISACVELKAKSDEPTENLDNEANNISFEEFLAQEKKDIFWQKYGKLKSGSGPSHPT